MLGLKLPTDPRWADIAEKNIEEILIDHAWCEQKAASTAISFIVTYPEHTELVTEMAALAREEMSHFEMVQKRLIDRDLVLGRERKDEYVGKVMAFFPKTGDRIERLVNRLLVSALIEARSCVRFKVLSENIKDQELSKFYNALMISEAGHYTLFLKFARQYGEKYSVEERWQNLLTFEAEVMKDLGDKELIHG